MSEINVVEQLFKKLEGAFARNTIRAYRSDFAHFATWCRQAQCDPIAHTPVTMQQYVVYMSARYTVATLNRRLASLSSIFKFIGVEDSTKNIDLYLLLKKVKRQKGSAQIQAEPLTKELIDQLVPFCGSGLTAQRNIVMLYLGNQTMRRRSELCQFRFNDILELPGQRYGIKLRFSKTDQEGKGKAIPITSELLQILRSWQTQIERVTDKSQNQGFILRGVLKNKHITASLSPNSINRILKDVQQAAGLSTKVPFSGHSFRVGGALDLLMSGVAMEKIMLRGGWSSESTVIRYLRAWDLMDDG